MVVVSEVTSLVDLANRCINLHVQDSGLEGFDEENHRRIREFAKDGKWIELDGNRLSIRLYQSREEFENGEKSRQKMLAGDQPSFQGKVSYDEPFVQFDFGEPNADQSVIRIDNLRDGNYNSLVVDHIRGQHTVFDKLDVGPIRDAFLKTGKTDPPQKR
jgi:hypothetical protein